MSGPDRKLVVSIVIFQVAALPKNGNVEIEAIAQIGKKILYSFYTLNFSVYNIKIWKIRNYILHFSIILNFYIYIYFFYLTLLYSISIIGEIMIIHTNTTHTDVSIPYQFPLFGWLV